MFMIQKCFIDESYDKKLFVLSCSVGLGERWKEFENAWGSTLDNTNARLAAQGRPLLSRYHAVDCAGGFNEFKGWSLDEQIQLTADLIDALKLVPMHSVAYTVLLDDLRDVWSTRFKGPIEHEHLYIGAYMLTMQFCMMRLGEYLFPLNPDIRISFIHDHSDYDGIMLMAYNHIKFAVRPPYADLFSTIAPLGSKDCLPLQLADFLAYEFFRDRGAEEFRGEDYRRRKSLNLALQTGTGVSLRTFHKSFIEG
jgi:hypothetical protein